MNRINRPDDGSGRRAALERPLNRRLMVRCVLLHAPYDQFASSTLPFCSFPRATAAWLKLG